MKKFTWMMLFIFGSLHVINAQDEELAPVTTTIAITNVNIVPSPGQLIQDGTVLMKDGIIVAVGKNIAVPPGARIVKADSMYVYSGFILGMSHVGIKMPKKDDRPDVKIPGNPPRDVAGITPERNITDFLTDEKSINEYRELGFTVAQTAPEGGMLPGQASVILLKSSSAIEMMLKPETALFATFEGGRRVYPATAMGIMAKFRELYRQAEQAKKFSQMYSDEPSGMKRPYYDPSLVAFYPVLERKIPVAYKGTGLLDAQRALLLKNELGFDLVITELKEGWDIVDKVKNSNAKVLFSLDLPEWKDEEKKDSVKQKTVKPEKKDKRDEALEKRKEEFAKKYFSQAALYHNAGVSFGFSSLDAKSKDIKENLFKMVENGLSEDAALAALTTNPASILGINRITGTIENGKMANLVISTKPYFNKEAKVKYVFVEGKLHEYDLKEKKKSDEKAIVKVVGNWSYTAETPNGPVSGNIKFNEVDGVLSGTISNDMSNEASELNDVLVSGNNLTFSFKTNVGGEEMKIDAVLTIDGDTFEGSLSAPQFGSIPIEGSKQPEK